jgi:hypothetical protein
MLKRWALNYWPLAVLVVLVAAVLCMSQYAESRKAQYQNHAQVGSSKTSIAPPEADPNSNKANNTQQLPSWIESFTWTDGVTTWVLCLTLLVIGWQSNETRRTAQATADAANAAYGSLTFAEAQLEMMREKERARLELNVQRTDLEIKVLAEDLLHLVATVSVRNIGASKAFIMRTSGVLITKVRGGELGEGEYSPLDLPDQFINPDKPSVPIKVYCFPPETVGTFAECMEIGTFSLHFFGFIEYESMGIRWRRDFGYDWNIVERGTGLAGLYGISDPFPNSPQPARDRITYGYWGANEEKNKPEYRVYSED